MHRTSPSSVDRRQRVTGAVRKAGFTLVELLVAIVIFVILVTLVVSAFQQSDQDRAAAGAQELRSMLEGARSRAIHDNELRGIRLVLDNNNPQTVTSLVYIGSPRRYSGTVTVRWDATNELWLAELPSGSTRWENLRRRNLLPVAPNPSTQWNTLRMFLGEPGSWYVVRIPPESQIGPYLDSGNLRWLPIAGHYHVSNPDGMGGYQNVADQPYQLELAAPILPGSVPRDLPVGVAIDLPGSKLPRAWCNDNGTDPSDSPTSYWTDDSFSSRMDILFTPRGDVVGTAMSAGVLHFVLADIEDILLDDRYPFNSDSMLHDNRHPALRVGKADRMVTLFPRTGLVTTSQVNHISAGLSPYEYAFQGQDAP